VAGGGPICKDINEVKAEKDIPSPALVWQAVHLAAYLAAREAHDQC